MDMKATHTSIVTLFICSLLIFSCKKDGDDKDGGGTGDGYVTYYGLNCGNGPYNCTVNDNQATVDYFKASITEQNGVDKLLIEISTNFEISVTYTGVGSYSTNNTDLMYELCIDNGLSTFCYRTDSPPQTGGYMEITEHSGGYIEGNFRFVGATSASTTVTSMRYTGMDNGLFRIKLQ